MRPPLWTAIRIGPLAITEETLTVITESDGIPAAAPPMRFILPAESVRDGADRLLLGNRPECPLRAPMIGRLLPPGRNKVRG